MTTSTNQAKRILILNGSLGGDSGNTKIVIDTALGFLKNYKTEVEVLHLENNSQDFESKLLWADGFIFTTGTYWDSWGSPMQSFLEKATEHEASGHFLFKPASVLVTMHSVGGKSILSRLQGVLNTMGMAIPPMSGLVYSLNTHMALMVSDKLYSEFKDDFWSLDDVETVVHNLITAANHQNNFKSWPVDRKDPKRKWLKTV